MPTSAIGLPELTSRHKITPEQYKVQEIDLHRFPGVKPGDVAATPANPLLYSSTG